MLKLFAVILLIIGGIESSDICKQRCNHNNLYKRNFPETKEELLDACKIAIDFYECEIAQSETCFERVPVGTEFSKRSLVVLREICSEDTLLHAAVLDHLKCYSKLVNEGNRACNRSEMENVQEFVEALNEQRLVTVSDNELDTFNLHECIDYMDKLACESLIVEKACGNTGLEIFVEILQKAKPNVFDICDDSYHLLPVVVRLRKEKELKALESTSNKN